LSRLRILVCALAVAVSVPVAVAGCGSSSSSNSEDPNQVLKETFNNPTKITSGNLGIDLSGSAEGTQSGSLNATIDGPFQSDASNPDAFPQFDLTAKVSASGAGQSFNVDGGLITTKDNAYVEYQGQAYEVGTALFNRFQQSYQQAQSQAQAQGQQNASSIFDSLGIDPSTWLTNVSNEGTTDVDGTNTIHIHGDADVPKILSDIQKIAQQTGGTAQSLTPSQIDQVQSAIKTASIDVYSGESDKLLRKLALTLTIEPPASTSSGVSSVNVNFSVTLGSVNEPQTITAPSNTKPLRDLLHQFGAGGLAPLLGAGLQSGAGASSSSGY
jgi:hypothetical protein